MTTWSKADCIEALREVADELGHTPSRPEYKETGKWPSATTISKKLGGWARMNLSADGPHAGRPAVSPADAGGTDGSGWIVAGARCG